MQRVVWLALGSLLVVSAAGQPFTLRSLDFRDGAPIPAIHGCTGRNVAPMRAWAGVSPRTRSFALVVVDSDLRSTCRTWPDRGSRATRSCGPCVATY